MSSFVFSGTKKKSKKGKKPRDESPSYGQKGEGVSGPVGEISRQTTDRFRDLERENKGLGEELRDAQNKIRVSKEESSKLRRELDDAKQDASKTRETTQGNSSLIPSAVEEEKARLTEDLQTVQKEIENERQKGEERVTKLNEDVDKLSEDLNRANKALETERNTGEAKVNKLTEELKQVKLAVETEKSERSKIEEEKERYTREKDAFENKLAHTSKELEIAKKESHIPRSPTRAPSEEWKAKIEAAESELQKEREQRLEKERENSRLVNDKDHLEKEKQLLQDEIPNITAAKDKEFADSKAMKEEELEQLVNDKDSLEKENQLIQDEIQNITAAKDKEFADIKAMKEEELEHLIKNLEMNHKNDAKRLEDMVSDMKQKLTNAEDEKEKLLTRLSAQTAAQGLDNNPNVSYLSDPNRPQKLGEQMSQAYDEQWTDATEALEKLDKNKEEIVKTLLDILIAVYTHCKEAAENQLSRLEEDLFLPPLENVASCESPDTNGTEHLKSPTSSKHSMSMIPRFTSHKGRPALPNISTEKRQSRVIIPEPRISQNVPFRSRGKYLIVEQVKGEKLPEISTEVKKGIKEYRKKVIKQVWPVIEKEVLSKLRRNEEFDDKVIEACKPYITKCVELCWLMRVQDPPVSLSWSVPDDRAFHVDVYRDYVRSGSHCEYVEYVVWPVMYLYEGGPILMKGVAQGMKL